VLDRAMWRGSEERKINEKTEEEVKSRYLKSLGEDVGADGSTIFVERMPSPVAGGDDAFWNRDEGLPEIQKMIKTA